MCTVTYIPSDRGYFLTSNRDEKKSRKIALAPVSYENLIYPKDQEKNGTWIVAKTNGDALCLLNGAFTKHESSENYNISRGIVVLQIAQSNNLIVAFDTIDLKNVEPFTLIVVENNLLFETRWDGRKKYFNQLDEKQSYIWRSATLYDDEAQAKTQQYFLEWISSKKNISQNDIIEIHVSKFDIELSYLFKEIFFKEMKTVSVTSISKSNNEIVIQYKDNLNAPSNERHTFSYN